MDAVSSGSCNRNVELAVSIQIATSNAEWIEVAGTEAKTLRAKVGRHVRRQASKAAAGGREQKIICEQTVRGGAVRANGVITSTEDPKSCNRKGFTVVPVLVPVSTIVKLSILEPLSTLARCR